MSIAEITSATPRLERILFYGDPKTSKSRTALSCAGRPYWGEVLYVAADPGSEALASCTAPRSSIHVVKSAPESGKRYDPADDAFRIALMPWRDKYPNVGTLIWDTMTATSQAILAHVADLGSFSDRHIALGEPGSPSRQNVPMQGDYMATHNIISRLVDYLFRIPLHLIVVCHATYDEDKVGGSVEGGPATAGKATVRTFPGRFDSVVFLDRRTVDNQAVVTAHLEPYRIWRAGIRSHHATNPLKSVRLVPDSSNFFPEYEAHFVAQGGE